MLFIGPEAERRFGRRHFMGLMAVFTAPPEFTVLHGRNEIGRIDPVLLIDWVEGPRLLLLGGRSWRVTWTDWKRRRCFVEPAESGGRARWLTSVRRAASPTNWPAPCGTCCSAPTRPSPSPGARPGPWRACGRIPSAVRGRTGLSSAVATTTCAGGPGLATAPTRRSRPPWAVSPMSPSAWTTSASACAPDLRPRTWSTAVKELRARLCLPEIDDKALAGLKFSDALPRHLAVATLATRLADLDHAAAVLAEPVRFEG